MASFPGGAWLSLYFVLNLLLTLYNKLVLLHFPFPYTLSALHALCGSIGTFALLHAPTVAAFRRSPDRKRHVLDFATPLLPPVPAVQGRETVVVLLFSVLYTLNIVVSNASLRLVTVPFHQCVRASAPLFTIALSALLLGQYSSRAKLVSLVPVIAGVAFATYGDYYFTPRGFFLTLLGTLLAALKTIFTNVLQKPSTNRLKDALIEKALYPRISLSNTFTTIPSEHRPVLCNPDLNNGTGNAQTQPLLCSFHPDVTNVNAPKISSTAFQIYLSALYHRIRYYFRFPPSYTSGRLALPKLTLSPLQLLYLLSPLAFIQTTLLAHFTGELERVSVHLHIASAEFQARNGGGNSTFIPEGLGLLGPAFGNGLGAAPRMWLLINGILAFALNVVSFGANRKVGALGMSVAGNVKQALAVVCSVTLFNLTVTSANGLGIFLTVLGGAWYAAVELREKKTRILQATAANV